jgi:hypothetical protein
MEGRENFLKPSDSKNILETKGRENISDKIATLKKISIRLLTDMLSIMKVIVDDENDISEEIMHNLELPSNKLMEVNGWLQNYCDNLIVTAKNVKNEVDKFASAYAEGDEVLDKKIKEYPVLAEVWYGDTYGKGGVEGLDLLIKELEEDLLNVDENKIIEIACKQKF